MEEEENSDKKTTYDADENAEENERIHKDKDKVFTMEEEKQTLEYHQTMSLGNENIASTNQKIGYQYMKLFIMILLR